MSLGICEDKKAKMAKIGEIDRSICTGKIINILRETRDLLAMLE
jgi:hypothetical protein